MDKTTFRKNLLFCLSVPKCVGCGEKLDREDRGLCQNCLKIYLENKTRECSLCAEALCLCSCSMPHLDSCGVKKLIKVYRYLFPEEVPPQNMLLYSFKRENREDVLSFLADELSASIRASLGDVTEYVFTNVPRRRKAIVHSGIDHAALLAKRLATLLGATYQPILLSNAKKPQKGMHGDERIENARYSLRRDLPDLRGKRVIIVDDIVTTGASMGECARLIRTLRPKETVGACIAIAYRDKKTFV